MALAAGERSGGDAFRALALRTKGVSGVYREGDTVHVDVAGDQIVLK